VHLLLTNDDGIDADGLRFLARALGQTHRVTVVAPSGERSASGHSITLTRPLLADPKTIPGAQLAWSVDGTPADCVKLALDVLMADRDKPELVISGINHGSNLGRDVFYSGTVAAAIEASFLGCAAVAVSQGRPSRAGLQWGSQFIAWWLGHDFVPPPPGVVYNINLPAYRGRAPERVVPAPLGRRVYRNEFQSEPGPDGRVMWWLGGQPMDHGETPDSDVAVVSAGHVAITPLRFEVTAFDQLVHLREVNLDGMATAPSDSLPGRRGEVDRDPQ
jgi:5'-nucleotidase